MDMGTRFVILAQCFSFTYLSFCRYILFGACFMGIFFAESVVGMFLGDACCHQVAISFVSPRCLFVL
jgi:hypothetical protein